MDNTETLKFLLHSLFYIAYKKMLLILSSSKRDGRMVLAMSQQYHVILVGENPKIKPYRCLVGGLKDGFSILFQFHALPPKETITDRLH